MNTQTNSPIDEQHLPEPREVEVLEALQAEPVRRGVLRARRGCRGRSRSACRRRRRRARRAARRRACPGAWARAGRSSAPGRCRRRRTRSPPRTARAGRARCASGCTGRPAPGRSRRSCRSRRGSAATRRRRASGAGTAPPSRRRTTRVARCAGVSATSPGARNDSVACSRPCQPSLRPQRPKAPNSTPMPPSSAISDSTDQTITFGRRLVVDARLGRPVVGVGVVVAGAVRSTPPTPSRRRTRSAGAAACGSVIALGRRPCSVVGSEKKRL